MREEMHAVVQEISARRSSRRAALATLRKQVARLASDRDSLMQKLSDRRQREARRLRKDLARETEGLARVAGERRQATRAWISRVASSRLTASRRQRGDRTRGRAQLSRVVSRVKSDLAGWMEVIRSERAAARREWHRLASAPLRDQAREATAPAAPPEDAFSTLRGRIFAHLADYPDGVPLVQIEREFGLHRLAASRLIRSLIDDGKALKRERLYFAT